MDRIPVTSLARGGDRYLLIAAILTGAAALLHAAIIVGGSPWYRFFGAGERMATLAERGSHYPAMLTACIALVLGVWTLYALSGAGIVRPLPFLRPILVIIAAVFTLRGLLGVPAVLLASAPYMLELRTRMLFMLVTSALCLVLGVCYTIGAARLPVTGDP